jgi:hypothetical protein
MHHFNENLETLPSENLPPLHSVRQFLRWLLGWLWEVLVVLLVGLLLVL